MSYVIQQFGQEWRLMLSRKYILVLLICTLLVSGFSVFSGLNEVNNQHNTIERLQVADLTDRTNAQSKHNDAGSIAYYSFHLTYLTPSNAAFAALGERDIYPWKHRIRMLALEGQIYESDSQNAELVQAGKFDFVFVMSALAPLLIIALFHDLFSSERISGRYDLLVVTTKSRFVFWGTRSAIRFLLIFCCLMLPFYIGAWISGTSITDVIFVSLCSVIYLFFWTLLSIWLGKRSDNGPKIASKLIGLWVLFAFIIPILGDLTIRNTVHSPTGGEILLTQREAVNDAWDIPKEITMDAFITTHPQWKEYVSMQSMFEWKWYYAFQQVGDQIAAPLAKQYLIAAQEKYKLAGYISLISPPLLFQRYLTRMANTDALAALEYEQKIRDFHQRLRQFYYPFLFTKNKFEKKNLKNIPKFDDVIHQ